MREPSEGRVGTHGGVWAPSSHARPAEPAGSVPTHKPVQTRPLYPRKPVPVGAGWVIGGYRYGLTRVLHYESESHGDEGLCDHDCWLTSHVFSQILLSPCSGYTKLQRHSLQLMGVLQEETVYHPGCRRVEFAQRIRKVGFQNFVR